MTEKVELWCEISTALSASGVTLIELAGNVIGCWGEARRVPSSIYRQIARERIALALAALDRLDQQAIEANHE